MSEAVFYFALFKPECLELLKRDVAARYPELRWSFSRPGFATFKGPPGVAFAPWLVLASGISIGKHLGDGQAQSRAREVQRPTAELPRRHWRFHPEQQTWCGAQKETSAGGASASPILNLITLDRGSDAAEIWLGLSEEYPARTFVGAPRDVPANAPSRAYAKIVEVCAHWDIRWPPGEVVLELGAAPGGASIALLERGMHVLAVDPGEMAEGVRALATERGALYRPVQKKASHLDRADLAGLPSAPSWLVCDINLAPPVALTQLAHAYGLVKRSVHTLIWTCKINDDKALATVPAVLHRLGELTRGMPEVAHLPSHRREFSVVVRRQ